MPVKRRLHDFLWKVLKGGATSEQWKPDFPWMARVLGGIITHYCGEASTLDVRKTGTTTGEGIYLCSIMPGIDDETFGLNPLTVTSDYREEYTIDSTTIWFSNKDTLRFSGCTGSKVSLYIEVIKLDETTGEFLS